MGKLYTTLPLFSADYSSAASAVRDCGGLAVICCPSGCMGNYVRFDEPRWADMPGNVLQLDIQEMDMIFGDRDWTGLFDGLKEAHNAEFIGLVLTPVPSLVGFDSKAVCKRIKKDIGVPAISVGTNGYNTYHDGISMAMGSMFELIPDNDDGIEAAILGFSPLEYTESELEYIRTATNGKACFPGDSVSSLSRIRHAKKNILISSAAVPFARMMEERYGIPYEFYSQHPHVIGSGDRKILIVGEQVRSNMIRQEIRLLGSDADVATFFTLDDRFSEDGDLKLDSEDGLRSLAENGYDCIVGDPLMRPLFPENVKFISDPQTAVSSRLFWNERNDIRELGRLAEKAVH